MEIPLLSVLFAARERETGTDYVWDNRARPTEPVACVIQRTRSGAAFFETNGTVHEVPAGTAMFFSHGEASSYGYPPGATEPYTHEFVAITGPTVAPLFQTIQRHLGKVVTMPEDSSAARLLGDLVDRHQRRITRDRFDTSARIYELLMACCRLGGPEAAPGDSLRTARELLLSHFQEPLSLQRVAERAGLSREHFSRSFKHRYGQSPKALLTQLRMARARDILRASDASIEEVALLCGYTDANSFSRAFKSAHGRAPTVFRDPKDSAKGSIFER